MSQESLPGVGLAQVSAWWGIVIKMGVKYHLGAVAEVVSVGHAEHFGSRSKPVSCHSIDVNLVKTNYLM